MVSLPVGNRVGHGGCHSPPSSADVKNEWAEAAFYWYNYSIRISDATTHHQVEHCISNCYVRWIEESLYQFMITGFCAATWKVHRCKNPVRWLVGWTVQKERRHICEAFTLKSSMWWRRTVQMELLLGAIYVPGRSRSEMDLLKNQ
jgi:hypothetical protein